MMCTNFNWLPGLFSMLIIFNQFAKMCNIVIGLLLSWYIGFTVKGYTSFWPGSVLCCRPVTAKGGLICTLSRQSWTLILKLIYKFYPSFAECHIFISWINIIISVLYRLSAPLLLCMIVCLWFGIACCCSLCPLWIRVIFKTVVRSLSAILSVWMA